MDMKLFLLLLLYSAFVAISSFRSTDDLYEVLGVNRLASTQEIRKAYKYLVKVWHPDRNKDPTAIGKFTKINEAYETLGYLERRSVYDKHGYTASQDIQPVKNHWSRHSPRYFRSGLFGTHNFNYGPESIIDKYMITQPFYDVRILPQSYRQPYFLYAYGDTCLTCLHYEPLIEKLIKELEQVGIGVGTIHVTSNRVLGSNLRIHEVPQTTAVINGRLTYFKGRVTMQGLRDFIRNLFPANTMQVLTNKNFKDFLYGWSDNRIRALFFSPKEKPPVRFLMPAFSHREKIASGFVNTRSISVQDILQRFNVNRAKETLLMVGEDSNTSVAIITMNSLSTGSITEVLDANQYLTLPRLSSQIFFDELCPVEIRAKRRKLCVILVTKKSEEHDPFRSLFRNYVQQAPTFNHKVKFMYLYEETQRRFVSALMNGNQSDNKSPITLKLAILWRMDKNHMNYEWVEPGWSNDVRQNELTRHNLEKRLSELFTNSDILLYTAMLPDFHNEHALSLLVRIIHKFFNWFDRLSIFVTCYNSMTWISIAIALISVFLVGLLMRRMLNMEMENVMKQTKKKDCRQAVTMTKRPLSNSPNNSLRLYELCPKSYYNLVKYADPGFTIVVLLDEDSQETLMTTFLKIMEPYSRSNTLTFSYLQLDQYLAWYRHLLEESIDYRVQLSNIHIRNCIGTVLAINGHRQYYYIYHAKTARKGMRQLHMARTADVSDSDSDSDDSKPWHILEKELLDGLDSWLNKIFEGQVRKIQVSYWPDISHL